MGNKPSGMRSSSRAEDTTPVAASGPSLALAEQQQGEPSGPVAKLLTGNIASEAFNSARSTFRAFDRDSKGYIEFAELSTVFEQLGANFSAEEISMVFQESDMMEDGRLNFKEFLVCLAIGFVLHVRPNDFI
ncbi:unnamed protein product [Phytophthora fragariaefolia]|uniref:Unnamed protein product n=1 Tax=Phytophthora fragariaefolia TaxID=1490495 RepID=A0A9W6U3C3_9STRA|nr:unnamed protein product [Phytophthora fragariaefolia]